MPKHKFLLLFGDSLQGYFTATRVSALLLGLNSNTSCNHSSTSSSESSNPRIPRNLKEPDTLQKMQALLLSKSTLNSTLLLLCRTIHVASCIGCQYLYHERSLKATSIELPKLTWVNSRINKTYRVTLIRHSYELLTLPEST